MKHLASLLVLAALTFCPRAARANVYNVTNTTDGAGTVTSIGGGSFNASTLRAAVNAANAVAGAHTINVPAGTYTLTLGELALATNLNSTVTVSGTGTPANTIVQHDTNSAVARVFDLDPNLKGGVSVTLQNLTIAHGRNNDGFGGAGIICGFQGPPSADTTVLSNCVVFDNQVVGGASGAEGGGLQNIGGILTVTGCTFDRNSATNFSGGAIYYNSHSPSTGTLQVVNCLFTNNTAGDVADGGGAIFVSGVTNSALSIGNSTFIANRVISVNGSGGAVIKFGTARLTMTRCTFLTNRALGNSITVNNAAGGAVDNAGGPMTIQYCRFVGNTTAVAGHGNAVNNAATAGGALLADNNWWASNTGPGANDLTGAITAAWLKLNHFANPSTVAVGNSTTLTATFLTNSAGTFVPVSNLGVLIGLPVTFNNAVHGAISSPQSVIQASGTATATFTVNQGPSASADAVVDGAPATAIVTIPCPTITGTVSGGGAVCAGNSALVSVSISGGAPPYSVTLNNGGGTHVGSSSVIFTLSPAATTTYSVTFATDANGCPATVSGSATITVTPLPATPVITATPVSVYADSVGNQASAPAGYATYAWTISNGAITGPANGAAVTYNAGNSGNVTLALTVSSGPGCTAANSILVPILPQPITSQGGCPLRTNYFPSFLFTDGLPADTTGLAWDGTNYWSTSGGSSGGLRCARYDSNGVFLASYAPGLDYRSIFTGVSNAIFARQYNDPVIYQQIAPGVFTNSGVALVGGPLDLHAQVILNGLGTEYICMNTGLVSRWNLSGAYLGSVALQGFGTVTNENVLFQNRSLAALGDFWLTYNGNRIVSVWDQAGIRLATTVLSSAGTNFDSGLSFSYCNGKLFVVETAGAVWRGYDVCAQGRVAIYAAPSTTTWNTDVQARIAGTGLIPQVDAFLVSSPNPLPTTNDLRKYQAILAFSDTGYNNSTNFGNTLADYADFGGGVTLATFSFYSGPGYSIQGRVANGSYLPFTTAGSAASPGNLTLVKDLASHPLLDGVNSFNGGTASFLNTPITLNAGSVQAAHWSNGQPLVGGRDLALARTAGLNFYPPSSAARNDFWQTNTDGGRLLANALLWSGKIPPAILAGPSNLAAVVGATISLSVTATGSPPLAYQWRKDGTNLLGATTNTLTFVVQPGSLGAYRVVVSNPAGQTISSKVQLSPALRFLPPVTGTGASLPLYLANVDGSALTPDRAARIHVYTATNVALPFTNWSPLSNSQVIVGGQLRVDGLSATNARSFFRARETP